MRFVSIFVVLFVFCVSNAQAQIYTCKDANGNTIYTDSPSQCANAEEIKADALPTLVPTKRLAIPASNRATKPKEDKNAYKELVITSPANDSTIRDNQGNLTINFRVSPGLQTRKGHKYLVSVNGKEVYKGTSTITALKNVDRGTLSIGVKVVDTEGNAKISATPVSVTLQRFSALQSSDNTGSDSGSNDNDAGNENNSDDETPTITNQKFPRNTQFNRPATPSTAN